MPPLHRRSVLRAIGAVSTGFVAGCNASPDQSASSPLPTTGEPTTDADQSGTSSTATDTSTPTDTQTRTETPAPAFSGEPGPLPDATWPLSYRGVTNGSYAPNGPRFDRDPVVEWRIEEPVTGEQESFDPRLTHPVIADGHLYTTKKLTHGPNQAAPEQHYLLSFDAASGTERWRQSIREGPAFKFPTAPAVGGQTVLVGHDRVLRAHAAETGEERWRRDLGEPIYAIYPTADRIYVRAHRSIYGLGLDGTVTWSTELDNYPGDLVLGTRNLYVGASRRLRALDPETGERRWARTLPATKAYGIRRLVSVDGGVFGLQHSGDLYTFDDNGQPAWRPDGSFGAMSTDGGRLYTSAEGVLRCFSVAGGKQVWELQCTDLEGCDSARYVGKPVLTNEIVYVPIDGGILAGVDPGDGSVQWSITTDRDVPQITIGDDGIYSIGDYEESIERRVAPGNSDR